MLINTNHDPGTWRGQHHAWAWRLIHRLSVPGLFAPKLTTYRCLQKTLKRTKTAPVFPTESAVRPSRSKPPILPLLRHSPTNDTRPKEKKKKIKNPKGRDPSFVICDCFILPTSSYFPIRAIRGHLDRVGITRCNCIESFRVPPAIACRTVLHELTIHTSAAARLNL